ncbi:MAG: hypothetical protein AAFX40_12840, partial [Cyanobacteria bacterium J06639_1]
SLSERVSPQRPSSARLEFANLFHPWDFIESDTVLQPAWRRTKTFPLSPATLLRRWQNPRQLLGVSFGDMTQYAVIDIDRGSDYHPDSDPSALDGLRASFEAVGLTRSLLVRSSASGGLHLYFPLPTKVKTWSLAALLHVTCIQAGFDIKPGTLELFPNVKQWAAKGDISLYKAHRLPLQQGSCLLDSDGAPATTDLEAFIVQWQTAANNQDAIALRKAIKTASHRTDLLPFHHPRSRKASDFYKDDEAVIEQGWNQSGQTNELLCAIARHLYVFHDKSGDELARATAETARSRPGFEQFCNHKHDIEKRAKHWAQCVERKYYPYGTQKPVTVNDAPAPNDLRRASARDRITAAVAAYRSTDNFPSGITERANLLATNGLSLATLYRHKDLWHPDFVSAASVIQFPSVSEPSAENTESPPQSPQPSPSEVLQAIAPKKFEPLPNSKINKQPPREKLAQRIRLLVGQDWSDTLAQLVETYRPEVVEDAIAAFLQQRDRAAILKPGAWLSCAIRLQWKPNQLPVQPQASHQSASAPAIAPAAKSDAELLPEPPREDSVTVIPDCVRDAIATIKNARQAQARKRLIELSEIPRM